MLFNSIRNRGRKVYKGKRKKRKLKRTSWKLERK
jgi:hypothetical protein